jgi:hypothetical protein
MTYSRFALATGMEKHQRWENVVLSSVVESDPDPPGSAFICCLGSESVLGMGIQIRIQKHGN